MLAKVGLGCIVGVTTYFVLAGTFMLFCLLVGHSSIEYFYGGAVTAVLPLVIAVTVVMLE